jgi:hypothetical protein
MIYIFKSAHVPDEINDKYERLFKKSDIIFLENGVNDNHNSIVDYYNSLSGGKPTTGNIKSSFSYFSPVVDKELSVVKDSKKRIELENSRFNYAEIVNIEKIAAQSGKSFLMGDFDKSCKEGLKFYKKIANVVRTRDEDITKQLQNTQEQNSGKTIFVSIGPGHYLAEKLANGGIESKTAIPYNPYVLNIQGEITSKLYHGIDINENELARVFPSACVQMNDMKNGISIRDSMANSRKAVESLSYEDIEKLSKYVSRNLKAGNSIDLVVSWMKKHKK